MFKRNRLISQAYRWASINIEQTRWSNGYCQTKPFYKCSTNIKCCWHQQNESLENTAWKQIIAIPFPKGHVLLSSDYQVWMEFCQWLLGHLEQLDSILFADECTFTRENTINMHNLHMWSLKNPHVKFERNFQHRIVKWCGLKGSNIIGPSVLSNRLIFNLYLKVLWEELSKLLEDVSLQRRVNMLIQQDGVPPHYGREVKDFLNWNYPNRWIDRQGPIAWSPRSPDLKQLDFYLWGHMKSLVQLIRKILLTKPWILPLR